MDSCDLSAAYSLATYLSGKEIGLCMSVELYDFDTGVGQLLPEGTTLKLADDQLGLRTIDAPNPCAIVNLEYQGKPVRLTLADFARLFTIGPDV